VATITRTEPVAVESPIVIDGEFRETCLEIYARQNDEDRLVTSIEILSPTNKSPGHDAQGMWVNKVLTEKGILVPA
jgi:hypothetical protein